MTPPLAAVHQLLTKLRKEKPFTRERVGELLKTKLIETSRNDYFAFLEGKPVDLDGGLSLAKIDLRLRVDGKPSSGFLVLDIDKPCVGRKEIFSKYGDIKLESAPTGRSPDEKHSYLLEDDWGKMSFGFAEKNPDCLATIVLDPK